MVHRKCLLGLKSEYIALKTRKRGLTKSEAHIQFRIYSIVWVLIINFFVAFDVIF